MLNSRGVSEQLEVLYQEYKQLAEAMYEKIASTGRAATLLRELDLLTSFPENTLCYVKEGYLKLMKGNREIRMFSNGDFVPPIGYWSSEYRIVSDFKSDLIQFSYDSLLKKLGSNIALGSQWIALNEVDRRLTLCLCGEFAPEILDVEMVVKNFAKGEIILSEGKEATAIYEMISGKADVYIKDIQIGTIGNSELFGELGFLANNVHSATIIAKKNCFVRILEPHVFFHLIEHNSQFSITLLKNMAQRVDRLNAALVQNQSE